MGISLGVCVLTRTVLKFYWIILGLLIFFYFFKSEDIKKRLKYLFLFIFSYSIIILPYHLRNYKKLKTLSIESYQGASAMWSIMPLIENTDYEKLYQKDISYKEILDILKEKNVKATFFLIGYKVENRREIVERIYKEGHGIGLHSYT
ncbi:MAG: polysaccharide deacetylase family protein, partial [Elusimicrobiales bacterium]|nr:polysaccharide deacetylase family protein [Elusimicrobiales bacterium]